LLAPRSTEAHARWPPRGAEAPPTGLAPLGAKAAGHPSDHLYGHCDVEAARARLVVSPVSVFRLCDLRVSAVSSASHRLESLCHQGKCFFENTCPKSRRNCLDRALWDKDRVA